MNIPNGRAAVNAFYGDPTAHGGSPDAHWEDSNITSMVLPYPFRYVDDDGKVTTLHHIRVHRLVAESLTKILTNVWNHERLALKRELGFDKLPSYYDVETLNRLRRQGLDLFGGSYNFRKIRGASGISLHGYGAAVDMAPDSNKLGQGGTTFPDWFVQCFKAEGWVWGGDFRGRKDPMHFQAASGC